MELYIARHGETEYNATRRIQGSGIDSPLTEKGIAQAKALGKSLEGLSFDAVYSSPLKRAQDTVKHAFNGKHTPILDERVVEVGLGAMEGMYWKDADEKYAGYSLFDPVNYVPPPGGEVLTDMLERVNLFMEDISKTGHKKVFVLSHGYTCRVFQACVTGKTLEAIANAHSYDNCHVAHYRFEDGLWELLGVLNA